MSIKDFIRALVKNASERLEHMTDSGLCSGGQPDQDSAAHEIDKLIDALVDDFVSQGWDFRGTKLSDCEAVEAIQDADPRIQVAVLMASIRKLVASQEALTMIPDTVYHLASLPKELARMSTGKAKPDEPARKDSFSTARCMTLLSAELLRERLPLTEDNIVVLLSEASRLWRFGDFPWDGLLLAVRHYVGEHGMSDGIKSSLTALADKVQQLPDENKGNALAQQIEQIAQDL